MPELPWAEIRDSLMNAIRDALPLQVRKAAGERIAGLGLHIDAYYGSAGLYLLPESAAHKLDADALDNIGDWPISTDWVLSDDHSQAFSAHWKSWEDWFSTHRDDITDEQDSQRGLLRIACEAIQRLENAGLFDGVPKTEDFKIIIQEHDEPTALGVERYRQFVRTGLVRCDGDP
ncbi:hypothetical protein Pan44_05380 [Caulifigura coniformis]|uniref:DUF4303 domain-containing protein n=1 Tax=Caulifigura coniformis TaxID=2527983 RepID=A0A517S8U2_9PLAN|nr:hypothetical protein [Caulifigura coniformis]QDT52526.1 hypothetical protein Pan44_05380 [Caulifigura coniformis]